MAETQDIQDTQAPEQDGTPKLAVKDFAAKIKAKYPQYQNVDDSTLVQKIISKYPEYKDQVDFGQKKNSLPASQTSSPVSTPSQSQSGSEAQSTSPQPQEQPVPQQTKQPQPFDPATFMRQARANIEKPAQDNTIAVQPSQTKEAIDSQLHKEEYQQRKKEIAKEAVVNSTAQYLKNKGIYAPVGSVQFNQQLAKTQSLVDNGQAAVAINPDGQIGLKRTTGFLENIKNGWEEATKSEEEANDFTNNMTAQQRVDYVKSHDVKQPDQFIGEQPTLGGSLGHFVGSSAPFLGKAAVGAGIGAAAVATAPESMGASLAGLPTAMSFILTAPDMANQGAQQEIIRRYQILKNQHPEMSDTEAMEQAGNGALAGGIGGILTNAALMGTGLKTPVSLEAKGVIGKTLQEVVKSGVHMGGISAGITGAQELESEAEGIHTSTSDKMKDIANSFKNNATTGLLLTTLTHGIPNVLKSAIKYGLKDTPPDQIRNVLQANENAGTVPEGTTDKIMSDISGYNDALNKTVDGLSPEATASVVGLIQKKNNLIAESKTKDESFKPLYKEKIDAIDQQIQDIQRTGKPFEHEIDEATGQPYQQPTYDDVAQQKVQDLAQKIAKGKPVSDPADLQVQQNFPKELKGELQSLAKEEKTSQAGKENPKSVISDNIDQYLKDSNPAGSDGETATVGKPAEPVSSPVISENDVKAAQSEHDKAKAKLSDAERKLAEEQGKQTDMFGGGVQQGLFEASREDSKAILDPLRQKVKETKAALDKIQNDFNSKKDTQPDLFEEKKSDVIPESPTLDKETEKLATSLESRNKTYKLVNEIDEPTDARGLALQYFAGGNKVDVGEMANEVTGNRKTTMNRTGKTSDAKGNTMFEKNGQTVDQVAHNLWDGLPEHLQDNISTQDIRNELLDVMGSHGSRFEAAKEYVESYHPEYIEAKREKEDYDYWYGLHQKEVEAEEKWLEDEANKQKEFEESPEYIQQLINESSTTSRDAETADTGSKEKGNTPAGDKTVNEESGSNPQRPTEDNRPAEEGQQQGDKGESVNADGYTGIKNVIVDAEREAQGKEPLRAGGDGTMARAEQTLEKIKSGEISEEHIRDLTQALATGNGEFKTNLKPDEIQHVLMYDRKTLQDKGADIDNQIIEAKGNNAELERLYIKRAQNEQLLEANDLAAAKTGRIWSDAGRARQLIIKNDYTFEAMKRKYKARGDGEIPKEAENKLRDLSKEIQDKDKAIEEHQKLIEAANQEINELKSFIESEKEKRASKQQGVLAFDELKKETKSRVRSEGRRTIEKIKFEREHIKASIKTKWKNYYRGETLGANKIIPVEMVPDLVKLAKSYIEETLAIGKEAILDKIIDRVHRDVVDAIGDIDKTTVRDAITGYGKIKKPNTDPVDVAFRDIAAQGRLVSGIELAEKGEPPLKSGAQRDKPTAEQRRLQKELNKAIKDNNIQVKSPEEQIKTSLDAAKTRLKNQIEDLSDAIDKGEKIVKDRKGITYDEEANKLKSERDALRDEYDKIFGTNKELTDEDRIERASKAVQKSIDKLNERIENKDFSQNKKVDLKSPELDALKKQREGLQKVYKNLMDAEGETNRRKLEALKKHIQKRTAYLNEIRSTGNLDKFLADRVKKKTVLDEEAIKLKAQELKVKNDVDNMLKQREFDNMNKFFKGMYWANRFMRGNLIFGLSTLERIAGSVLWRAAYKAPSAVTTYGISKMFPKFFKGAHTEAIQSRHDLAEHLATYYSTLFSKENLKGFKFAFKQHNTVEDLLQGRAFHTIPIPKIKVTNFKTAVQAAFFATLKGLDINASIHGAEKNLVSYPDYKAYQKTIAANLIREGMSADEMASDATQSLINQLAYRKSLRTKFMQDNTLNKIQSAVDESLRRNGQIAYAEMLHGALPITKISSNYISEALTKIPLVGNLAAINPMMKIISAGFREKSPLTEKDRSILLRTLSYQGVGMATYMLGFMLYKNFLPLYGSSANKYAQKETDKDEDSGWAKAFETFSHSPDALVFQAAVSHGWVWDKYQEENPDAADMYTFMKNIPDNIGENIRDMASSSPYLQTGNTLIAPLVTGKGLPKTAANFITARTPGYGLSKQIAEGKNPVLSNFGVQSDNEEKVKPYEIGLHVNGFMDNIGLGIPGWRERVLRNAFEQQFETPKPKKTSEEKHDAKVRAHEKKIKVREFKEQLNE